MEEGAFETMAGGVMLDGECAKDIDAPNEGKDVFREGIGMDGVAFFMAGASTVSLSLSPSSSSSSCGVVFCELVAPSVLVILTGPE